MASAKPSDADIVLDLSDHCIETASKREYRRLVNEALQMEGEGTALEDKLKILQEFIENTDFRQLRSARPELSGGSPVKVFLRRLSSGRVGWSIVDGS